MKAADLQINDRIVAVNDVHTNRMHTARFIEDVGDGSVVVRDEYDGRQKTISADRILGWPDDIADIVPRPL